MTGWENIFGLHMRSAQRIDPAMQNLTVGDCVRLVPEGTEPALRFAVARVEPPHVLVLGPDTSRDVAFAAGLRDVTEETAAMPTGQPVPCPR